MRNTLLIGAALAFVASGAMAQTPPAKDGPQNSAVNSSNSTNRMVDAPVKGATASPRARRSPASRSMGFANVNNLKKDDTGVWRGQAMKNGQQVDISLDYQGNVIEGGAGSTVPGNAARGAAGR